jgi:hypothetical protein
MGDISIKGRSPILRQGYAVGGPVRDPRSSKRGLKGLGERKPESSKRSSQFKAEGGRIGLKHGGKPWGSGPKPGTTEYFQLHTQTPKRKRKAAGGVARRPKRTWPPKHKDLMRRFPKRNPHRDFADIIKDRTVPNPRRKPGEKKEYQPAATGGRIGFKKGTDKRWIQKATASIKKRGTKGKCTPITKPGCTGRAKALAKTFKKMAKKRKAA